MRGITPALTRKANGEHFHPAGHFSGVLLDRSKVSRQVIKDRNDRVLGYIETLADGRQKATDRNSKLLGWFDPHRNVTTDAGSRTLAKANVLSGLIFDQR